MENHKIQCFWGEQETHYDLENTVSVSTDKDAVKISVITQQNKIVTDDKGPNDSSNVQIDSQLNSEG